METGDHFYGLRGCPDVCDAFEKIVTFAKRYQTLIQGTLRATDQAVERTGEMPLVDITLDEEGTEDLETLCDAIGQSTPEQAFGTIVDIVRSIRDMEPSGGGEGSGPPRELPMIDFAPLIQVMANRQLRADFNTMIDRIEIWESDRTNEGEEFSIRFPDVPEKLMREAQHLLGINGNLATLQQILRFQRMMRDS